MGKPRSPKGRALATVARLAEEYPEVECPLHHSNPFELLCATILSAQCTDEMVNKVTPALFARFPDPESLAAAELPEVEEIIKPTGFFHNKAISLTGMARGLVDRFGGEVPDTLEELVTLPGVGRKTANVILGQWFKKPGITVDTHVGRLSRRLGLTEHTDAVKAEKDLMRLWPKDAWTDTSMRLIYHGRRVCYSRKPACDRCVLNDFCPSAFKI